MSAAAVRAFAAEAIAREVGRAVDPYVALFSEQPEDGYVCGYCSEERDEPHAEMCVWKAARLFIEKFPGPGPILPSEGEPRP